MTTIKIKSTHEASQGPFVIIEKSDFDPSKHELFEGEDLEDDAGERAPTMTELLAARDQLLARERELNAKADALAEQERANQAEAQRLLDEAAAQAAAPKKPGIADLRDQLTAKGIPFDQAASKADLQALLDAAPPA